MHSHDTRLLSVSPTNISFHTMALSTCEQLELQIAEAKARLLQLRPDYDVDFHLQQIEVDFHLQQVRMATMCKTTGAGDALAKSIEQNQVLDVVDCPRPGIYMIKGAGDVLSSLEHGQVMDAVLRDSDCSHNTRATAATPAPWGSILGSVFAAQFGLESVHAHA